MSIFKRLLVLCGGGDPSAPGSVEREAADSKIDSYRAAADIVERASKGEHIIVTKPPPGMTLAEAQALADAILADVYPEKMRRPKARA